ncbi:MAG: hypothetical protein JST76_07335 [Bacteroidetes bacterium]|nr:hypothetical protein [Bacteroidota bacterium]
MKNFKTCFIVCLIVLLSSCTVMQPLTMTPAITYSTYPAENSGAITINSNYYLSGVTYHWSTGLTTSSNSLLGLSAQYLPFRADAIFTYGGVGPMTYYSANNLYVLCEVFWNNGPGSALTYTNPIGDISTTSTSSSAAYSSNVLTANTDGFLEFKVGSTGANGVSIGFTDQGTAATATNASFGLAFQEKLLSNTSPFGVSYYNGSLPQSHLQNGFPYIIPTGITRPIKTVYAFYNGSYVSLGSYREGDRFRIKRLASGTVQFEKNDVPLPAAGFATPYTISTSPSTNMVVVTAFTKSNTGLTDVRTTFTKAMNFANFAELTKELDAGYVPMIRSIRFKYNEKYNTSSLNYKIYDWHRAVKLFGDLGSGAVPATPTHVIGDNYEVITPPASGPFALVNNQLYILEVTNDKGETYKLRFKYLTQ